MSIISTFRNTSSETGAWRARWPREPHPPADNADVGCGCPSHRIECLVDCSACGDIATVTDVAKRLRAKVRQPVSVLAHWIVDRSVVTFSYGAGLMLPLFQFDFDQGCVRSGAAAALSELTAVMTDEEIARWFSLPNTWLNGAVPAQLLLIDVPAVLAAARADRFVAKG
jgi:hypothetical protein